MTKSLPLNPRQKILLQVFPTCLITYWGSTVISLSTVLTIAALALGITHYLLQKWIVQIQDQKPSLRKFKIGFWILCLMSFLLLAGFLPKDLPLLHTLFLLIQMLGFYLIGIFLFKIKSTVQASH